VTDGQIKKTYVLAEVLDTLTTLTTIWIHNTIHYNTYSHVTVIYGHNMISMLWGA